MLDEFDEFVIIPDNVKSSDISEKLKNEMTVFQAKLIDDQLNLPIEKKEIKVEGAILVEYTNKLF